MRSESQDMQPKINVKTEEGVTAEEKLDSEAECWYATGMELGSAGKQSAH